MLIDASLVLEGGGARCVFTAGMLDHYMEKDIYFKNVYSVSASAYIALNYISRQKGRTKQCNIDYMKKERMIALKSLLSTGNLLNIKLLFDKLPNREIKFDYDTFFSSPQKLIMSVTDIVTGEAVYFDHYDNRRQLMEICCNSNRFPVISKIGMMNGIPVLDGGMADAIPVRKALADCAADGGRKCVVILTKTKGYRKELKKNRMLATIYRHYPNFVRVVGNRPEQYNDTLELIDRLASKGEIAAYYPQENPPSIINCNIKRLTSFYEHGYRYARETLPEMLRYLES